MLIILKFKKYFRIENKSLKLFLLPNHISLVCIFSDIFLWVWKHTHMHTPYMYLFICIFYIDEIILQILLCNLAFSFDTLLRASFAHIENQLFCSVTKADVFSSPSFWHFPNHLNASITAFCVKKKLDFPRKSTF